MQLLLGHTTADSSEPNSSSWGAAAETVRGIQVKEDTNYENIWSLLNRRFGYQDDVERHRCNFNRRKQEDHENVALYQQGLHGLFTVMTGQIQTQNRQKQILCFTDIL